MDKGTFRKILPLLQRMPTLVMEKVLKFSLNKQNYKSIQAEVTAKSINNHGKEALLDIIQKITTCPICNKKVATQRQTNMIN